VNADPSLAWHALPATEVLARLNAREEGLSSAEAARRLSLYGPNRLPEPERPSALRRFLRQFHNILIYVLLIAGTITLLLGHLVDAAVIFGVVVINAVMGFIQEGKAERALESIRSLLAPQAMVVRDGHRLMLPAEQLVPGDIVVVQAGDRVPADLRLLRAKALEASEAVLTGEAVPVTKDPAPVAVASPLGDRSSMLFSGTLITRGQGVGVVVATGAATEIGRIGVLVETVRQRTTPLVGQMARFARLLTLMILLLSAATLAVGVWGRGFPVAEMFLAAVAIAVAAIPEGLPAIVTIMLAIGVERMARRNAIVRHLPAVETLGSVSVICSDKTGTFTKNEMTVDAIALPQQLIEVTGAGYDPHGEFRSNGAAIDPDDCPGLRLLLQAGLLCNDAAIAARDGTWIAHGDPMEAALIVAAMKAGLDVEHERRGFHRVDDIPFDPAYRFMATLHRDHRGDAFLFVKGAPERVLAMCATEASADGSVRPLDAAVWNARTEALAARGTRVLALAMKPLAPGTTSLTFADVEEGLTLLGLVGLLDPPRPEAIEAVARCRAAGIRVKMITGDHASTARAIGERLGLVNSAVVLTGSELDRLTPAELETQAEAVDIFARTAPEHKLQLVEALQRRGHIVAMTGDGVNDAPALRRADVGIAMGRKGSDAAKEAAEIVLADDNFATIAHAVEEGRTIYDNLKKTILFILPTNAAEALTVLTAIAFGLVLPISPVQILWVNMITAVTLALALAFEAPERDVMKRPPRDPREALISGLLLIRLIYVSILTLIATFGVFWWLESQGASIAEARTGAVNTLVVAEMWYLFATRRFQDAAFARSAWSGIRPALLASILVMLAQLGFTHAASAQFLFQTAPLDLGTWAVIMFAGSLPLWGVELEKALFWLQRRHALANTVALTSRG
jgi:magnesium-transporting ATPase (P-type)